MTRKEIKIGYVYNNVGRQVVLWIFARLDGIEYRRKYTFDRDKEPQLISLSVPSNVKDLQRWATVIIPLN